MNFKSLAFSVILILSFASLLLAADEDSEYIGTYDSSFILRPSVSISRLSLSIYDGDKKLIDYYSNNAYKYGVDLSILDFGAGISRKIPGSEKDESKRGKTDSEDYQVYYYARKLGIDLFYQRYRGFYSELGESDLFVNEIRRDMKMLNMGINAYYIFSDNFSLKAAFKQTEKQKKNNITFLLGFSSSYFRIDSDRSLMPSDYDSSAGKFAGYRGGKYINFALMPGVGFTYLASPDIYMTFFALMGAGVSKTESETAEGRIKKTSDIYKVNAKYSAGYNSNMLFAGASIILDFTVTSQFTSSTAKVGAGLMFLEFYAGVRF